STMTKSYFPAASLSKASIGPLRNNSLERWVLAPRGSRNRLGTLLSRTSSSHLAPWERTSDKPGPGSNSNRACWLPLRRSASISRIREPALARVMARFADVMDLPSLGTELVTRIVLGRLPASNIYNSDERKFRYASRNECRSSSVCSKANLPCPLREV